MVPLPDAGAPNITILDADFRAPKGNICIADGRQAPVICVMDLFELLPEPKHKKEPIFDIGLLNGAVIEFDDCTISGCGLQSFDDVVDLRSKVIAERGHSRVVLYGIEATKPRYPTAPLPSRPSPEEAREESRITAKIIMENLNTIISKTQPKAVSVVGSSSSSIVQQEGSSTGNQRYIQVRTKAVDPLEPPNIRHKRAPRGPPSPPTPLLHSPPRNSENASAANEKDWKIPSCISNWKNPYGYTIPLEKRTANNRKGSLRGPLAADGSNDLADALAIAERHSKKEVELRREIMSKMKAISASSTAATSSTAAAHRRSADVFEQSLFDGDGNNVTHGFGGKKLRPHWDDLQDQQLYTGSLFAKDASSAAARHVIYNLPRSSPSLPVIGGQGGNRVLGTERSSGSGSTNTITKIDFVPSKDNERDDEKDDKKYGLK